VKATVDFSSGSASEAQSGSKTQKQKG